MSFRFAEIAVSKMRLWKPVLHQYFPMNWGGKFPATFSKTQKTRGKIFGYCLWILPAYFSANLGFWLMRRDDNNQ
jgi:hypothetical protein